MCRNTPRSLKGKVEMRIRAQIFGSIFLFIFLTACASIRPTDQSTKDTKNILTVMTHDSFAVSEAVVEAFEEQYQVNVRFLASGDTGSALNKAILSKDKPLADVFYGVDNTFLSRALAEDIFEIYTSPMLEKVPDQFELDPEHRALPVDFGDVCPNYDIRYFETRGIPAPQNLEDFTKPDYRGLLVVQNPATSSPGLAFLLATVGKYGIPGYLDYWSALKENDVLVVNDWNTAYNTEFTLYGGTRPIVISYSSSPAAEIIFSQEPRDMLSTYAITADGSCFRQIEFVGILKGTSQRDLAERWLDFMLSKPFQEDMPLQMFVFPVNQEAEMGDIFTRFLETPGSTSFVHPDEITANREAWIEAWTEIVLR
jgi:thiamine transport system substrate-binding protein